VIERDGLVERSARLGARLQDHLRAFAGAHPELVTTVRGRGLLQGLVLRDSERAATVPARAIDRGVLVNVTSGDVVRFFPALNIPEEELFSAVDVVLECAAA
jgi:acetylornithine/succinyldiaminopimelate/putrescine aminotransferase